MSELMQYECPNCGGKVQFDSASQQMKCPYCDSEFSVEALRERDEILSAQAQDDMNWETPETTWEQGEAAGMHAYVCQSCGGQIMTDQTTAATKCPYCDSPVILSGQVSGELKPQYIIPFRVDKEAAKAALRKHFEGKPLLPKVFKDTHYIEEIRGVYVPVWLFDAEADACILFKAEKRRTWSDAQFHYKETKYFNCVRTGSIAFAHIPVDGSSKMDDTMMESLEPFSFDGAAGFQTAYLSGYLADKYDVSAEDSIARADQRAKQSVELAFRETVQGYDSVTLDVSGVKLKNGKAVYALYPVWLLNIRWNDQLYPFAMNGQTGKFVGNLPVDKGAAAKWSFIGMAIFTVLAFVFQLIFM